MTITIIPVTNYNSNSCFLNSFKNHYILNCQAAIGSIGTSIIPADEVHDGLQHGVHEGEELSQGVDGGAGLLGHR